MRIFVYALVACTMLISAARAADYEIVKEFDSSFGNVRNRVTLEIQISNADPISREAIETMMRAAIDRHRLDWPDVVSVRLWESYENDDIIQNRIRYAPDGCGWTGDDCTGEFWTDLFRGEIPQDLRSHGQPTEDDREAAEDIICRQDLQCWGDKNALAATFACEPLIESMARYDYKWTDGWLGVKLERFRWNNRAEGSLSYTGDEIQFQNGFGAWLRMTYWCHYNPETRHAEASVH